MGIKRGINEQAKESDVEGGSGASRILKEINARSWAPSARPTLGEDLKKSARIFRVEYARSVFYEVYEL